MSPHVSSNRPASDRLQAAIARGQSNLLHLQHPDGHWCGELIVDATLCADFILYQHWSDRIDPVLEQRCAEHIRQRQLPEGGWNIHTGGSSEINATVKCYFALKLAGDSPRLPRMKEARATALRLGGIPQMNTYGKLYLALLGQFPWEHLPAIPVELVLLPQGFPINLYRMSSWSRAMIVPLSIISHHRPTRTLSASKQLHELYPAGLEGANPMLPRGTPFFSRRSFFLITSRLTKALRHPVFSPLRQWALRKAEDWMLERMGPDSGGLAAVFPAMLNSIIAMESAGYAPSHPALEKARADFEQLFVDDPEDFRIQPCLSPVWDTAINLMTLAASGIPPQDPRLAKAAQWLSSREVRRRGDWHVNNPHEEPSGWAFEYDNAFYPDTDDTMMVLMALRHAPPDPAQSERALRWLMSFQCREGGWAAFDKGVNQHWLEDMPFADHNAILDPPCSDLTGRMLELLGYLRHDRQSRPVQRALTYLRRTQEDDGSWYGRWGVNYIYGTWQVLRGVQAIGENMQQDWLIRARDWLLSCQNEDGGWGESCASYDDPSLKGRGESTASQTAWALMGLMAADAKHSEAVHRGIAYLLNSQNRDGSWTEPQATGTGFPRVFYLRYDMYRNNFPLLALATYRDLVKS